MNSVRTLFRLTFVAALLAAASIALAQSQSPAPPMPPQLEPLPEIAPQPGLANDPELEPQITITRKEGETVEEARINGKLMWIKVTPRHGRPYFLIPDAGDGILMRHESLDAGLRVPLWVLFSF